MVVICMGILKLWAQAVKVIITKVMYVTWKICTQSKLNNNIRDCSCPVQGCWLTVFPSLIQGPKRGGASICLAGDVEASCVRKQGHHCQGM